MAQRVATQSLRFKALLSAIDRSVILRLPANVSLQLPSRGQVAVQGTINGREFDSVLEPDGRRGHWMRVDEDLRRAARVRVGDTASLEIEVTKSWPEPAVPGDLQAALSAAPQKIQEIWQDITPMARWEWVRWVNATADGGTRRRRVEISISKMQHGKRRPCCFDLSSCTDPQLARNGRLRES